MAKFAFLALVLGVLASNLGANAAIPFVQFDGYVETDALGGVWNSQGAYTPTFSDDTALVTPVADGYGLPAPVNLSFSGSPSGSGGGMADDLVDQSSTAAGMLQMSVTASGDDAAFTASFNGSASAAQSGPVPVGFTQDFVVSGNAQGAATFSCGCSGIAGRYWLNLSGQNNASLLTIQSNNGTQKITANGSYTGYIGQKGDVSLNVGADAVAGLDGNLGTATGSGAMTASLDVQSLGNMRMFSAGVNFTGGLLSVGLQGAQNAATVTKAIETLPDPLVSSTSVALSNANSGADNLASIGSAFDTYSGLVASDAQNGITDTAIIFLSSHGSQTSDLPGATCELQLGPNDDYTTLTDATLHSMLAQLPAQARKIVIIDACHSGAFASALTGIDNAALLASSPASDNSYYNDLPLTYLGVKPGGGYFSTLLASEISGGTIDLNSIASDITAAPNGTYAGLLGQSLGLEDFSQGEGTFSGFDPAVATTADFSGDLLGPAFSVPEPSGLSPTLWCLTLILLAAERSVKPGAKLKNGQSNRDNRPFSAAINVLGQPLLVFSTQRSFTSHSSASLQTLSCTFPTELQCIGNT